MPSINENLSRLADCLPTIRNAITSEGGTVSSDAGYEDIAAAILTIPGSSGTIVPSDIKSLTEPGTIAYTLARMADAKIDIVNAIRAKGGTVNPGDGMEEFPDDIDSISSAIIYGYHVNPNTTSPSDAVTYLGKAVNKTPAKMGTDTFDYGDWGDAFFLPKPCVLNSDGTVEYYLNPNDYSKKLDGTSANIGIENTTGNVMLEFPKIWIKRVPGSVAGERTVYISDTQVDSDYKCWSNINANNQEVDHFYMAAYNGTIDNTGKMRSVSGIKLQVKAPTTTPYAYAPNYTRQQEVDAATANNSNEKVMWYTETWADMCLVYDLLYLMGKSLDVQRTFGQGLSYGTETVMRKYITGTHNTKGLFYGNISGTGTAVKVLGMENLWCCRFHAIAGLINDKGTLKVKMTYGVADGSTAVGYNTTGSGYLNYGSTYSTSGFVKKMQANNTMGYKIILTAGKDTTYYCDYYYAVNSGVAYAVLGGSASSESRGGFYVNLYNSATNVSWDVGASLSCKPIS